MNKSFLYRIAERFWQERGEEVSKLSFVFPNRRAGLFFRKYLAELAGRPIFSPQILTINQLFQQLSTLQLADNLDLLFRLYNVYMAEQHSTESFDDFLFWGRMMLSDFNEIDQHLVDAQALFTNLHDLKEIEQHFEHLTAEETESVNAFVRNMHEGDVNVYKQRFVAIWSGLYPIYKRFREELRAENLAYMGMLQREVITTNHQPLTTNHSFVFIGFNALTGVERALMEQLRDAGRADFYWDYESAWVQDTNNRASLFCAANLRDFPSRYTLPTVELPTPTIHLVQIASSVGQAEVVRKILTETQTTDWTRVGIVLPNENMLLPVQHAIPSTVDVVNITMGQPLHQTPVHSLVQAFSELALLSQKTDHDTQLYYKPLMRLLHHPYVQAVAQEEAQKLQKAMLQGNQVYLAVRELEAYPTLQPFLCLPAVPKNILSHIRTLILTLCQTESLDAFDKEYLYQTLLIVNRLESLLLQHAGITMASKTLYSLFLQLLESTAVPFEGEPLAGLQIMGVLESRSMDFDTLILTDVNDETLPGHTVQNTYIPYDLRLYFGLPTTERQDAIFAYNFYRLLSHASTVYLLQNTQSSDLVSGEPSRYIYQLQYQYGIDLQTTAINPTPVVAQTEPVVVEKTPEVLAQISDILTTKGVSPSALNTYVRCPLKFYWQYICRLREADSIQEDVEANQLGTVLHAVLEELYGRPERPYKVSEEDIKRFLQRVQKTPLVEACYKKTCYPQATADTPLTGRDLLAVYAVKQYVKAILEHDKTLCPFFYHASEMHVETTITTPQGNRVKLHGYIDRVDSKNEQLRIVDYKSGKPHTDTPASALLFDASTAEGADHYRQTLLYALLYTTNNPKTDCSAALYYTRFQSKDMQQVMFESFYACEGVLDALHAVLDEIYNADLLFVPTDNTKHCENCPFALVCGR